MAAFSNCQSVGLHASFSDSYFLNFKMLLRLNYTVRDLEVGETPIEFTLVQSRMIKIHLRSPSAGELKNGHNRLNSFCAATSTHVISQKNEIIFNRIERNDFIATGEEWKASLHYPGPNGSRIYLPSLSDFPPHFIDFIRTATKELSESIRQLVSVLRWRLRRTGMHNPFSSRGAEWSTDGVFWHPCPSDISCKTYAVDPPLKLSSSAREEIELLVKHASREPIYHELHREASSQIQSNPRSALIIGISSLEVGIKSLIGLLVPDASWLAMHSPSPPITEILSHYIPNLKSRARGVDQIGPIPENIIKKIRIAVKQRNDLIHRGETTISSEDVEELLNLIKDILWLFDFHAGHIWTASYINLKEIAPR